MTRRVTTAADFEVELFRLIPSVKMRIESDVRRFLLAADRNLVLATPRDTGHAARNWMASLGSPRREVVGSPGQPENPQRAIAEAEQVLKGFRIGGIAYLSNNVVYLPRLATGYSPQQPQPGWIEGIVRQTAREIFKVAGL